MVSFLAVAPFVVWILIKKKYGIHNDLTEGGFHGLLERGWGRLTDGKSLWIILDWFFIKETGAWYFLVYFFFAFGTPFSPAKKKSLFCFTLGAAYLAILLGIFLTTPHDLLWHLTTSIGRVNYIPHILFISAIFYLIFDGAEARSPASPAPEPIRLQS